jgi:hypothetical protein
VQPSSNYIEQLADGRGLGGLGAETAPLGLRVALSAVSLLSAFGRVGLFAFRVLGERRGREAGVSLTSLLVVRRFVVVWPVDRTRRGLFSLAWRRLMWCRCKGYLRERCVYFHSFEPPRRPLADHLSVVKPSGDPCKYFTATKGFSFPNRRLPLYLRAGFRPVSSRSGGTASNNQLKFGDFR